MKKQLLKVILLAGAIFGLVFFNYNFSQAEPNSSELQAQLDDIELQISIYERELTVTKTEKKTLSNKIKQLRAEQAKLKLQVKQTTVLVTDLGKKINTTENQIDITRGRLKKIKRSMSIILRLMNQREQTSIIEMLAAPGNFSDFYNEARNYFTLSDALNKLVKEIKEAELFLINKQEDLEDKREDAKNLIAVKTIQQQELVGTLSEQAQLLKDTQGRETDYQQILNDTKKRAAEIRNRIYEMVGGGKQINFGEALEIAKWVSAQTGIRPAFLLAVVTQESNLGKNIGTCNRIGDPPEKSWRVIMKPERDQEPFKQITSELGKDIDTTPVSCPMKDKNGDRLGWGGAMGPAQFIPSTWMGYRGKVTAITGRSVANPWDNRDAFLASAIKLKADGADGTRDGEWKAAMRYFSGSTNTRYRFYGDNVLKLTDKYLADIAELEK